MKRSTRRDFIRTASLAAAATVTSPGCSDSGAEPAPFKGIVDIHQHVGYRDRVNDTLLAHQRAMGVDRTVLLPSATAVSLPSTHEGKSNGLAARARGNPACLRLAREHPHELVFFANEVPDLDSARAELEKYLELGAIGIGEQKFAVDCDSPHIEKIAGIARAYQVPVLLHFQHETYNLGFERFYKVLEKFPSVTFIGHAQTWWGNIDKGHDQPVLYPKGPVTPGGITEQYLSDYPNMFGDLSAGSGQNALTRDEAHAADFLVRHQDKLCYGSDCPDPFGVDKPPGEKCTGAGTLAVLRRLVTDPSVLHKILGDNARRIMRV